MQDDTQPNPPAQPTQGIAKKIAMLAVPAVVSAGVALGVLGATGNLGGGTTTVVRGEGTALTTASALGAAAQVAEVPVPATDLSVQELVKRKSPAVVLISNETSRGGSLGSGFLIDTAGHIVTNAHVMDGATKTTVTFQDGTEKRGTVLGVDTSTDVAVLKIDQVPAGVTPVPLGNSSSLTVGQDVVAIGNPYGYSGTATTGIVSALKRTITSPSDFPIQNAIQYLIDQGKRVEPHVVTGWWKDTGKVEDLLEANRLILDVIEPAMDGELVNSQIEGRVVIQAGARVINSHVRGPAVIGRDALIENAYVGPYSSIASGCVVRRAEIEHSILLERVHIEDLDARVESSLIGRDVTISRSTAKPSAYRFVLGDSSVIGLT